MKNNETEATIVHWWGQGLLDCSCSTNCRTI